MSSNPVMHYNLQEMLTLMEGFDHLSYNFTKDEIDVAIKSLPVDKSPGPDGFNGMFMKRCWQIISPYFYDLCQEFYYGNLNLQSITQIIYYIDPKKKPTPETGNDYHPSSLLNSDKKLLTKSLANRLHSVILTLVHQNQYGFIKNRTIQDCLARTFTSINARRAN